jgi:hypothetical protein
MRLPPEYLTSIIRKDYTHIICPPIVRTTNVGGQVIRLDMPYSIFTSVTSEQGLCSLVAQSLKLHPNE